MIIIHKQNIFDLFNEQNPPAAATQPSEIVPAPAQPDNIIQAPATDPMPNTQQAPEPDNAADQQQNNSTNIVESEVTENVE